MQKLVTIYLDNSAYGRGKMLVGSFADQHGVVEEHLRKELKDGWTVKALHGFGGNSDGLAVRGWVVALLEKQPTQPEGEDTPNAPAAAHLRQRRRGQ